MKNLYKKTKYHSLHITGNDHFEGTTLETELEIAQNEKRPIEKNAISSVFYTRKKYGVLPETDIRTDRFDLAQMAMEKLTDNARKSRAKKLQDTEATDVPEKSAEP